MANETEYKSPVTSLSKKRDVFVLSQVMFNGAKPKNILEKRRQLESKENWTLEYRMDNDYPFQVSLFRRAINDYLEVLNKADIQIITTSKAMETWLNETQFFQNNRYHSVKDWLFNVKSVDRQVDPNSVFIPIVNYGFPKRFDNGYSNLDKAETPNGIPYFEITNQSPEVTILSFNYDKVLQNTEDYLIITAGKWVYEVEGGIDKSADFYLEADKVNYYLRIPVKTKNLEQSQKNNKDIYEVSYVRYPFYPHMLTQTPYVSLGGASMCEYDCEGNPVEYNVSDYYGAIAFGCYMKATMSDKQVIEARNNFPIKYRYAPKCKAEGCMNGYCGFGETKTKCTSCEGSGFAKDINPFGDYIFETQGGILDDGAKTLAQPINYVIPPVASLRYISENFKEYLTFVANELCITLEQNMTNQAADAKRYDLMNKITLVTFIVEDWLRVCETILGFVESLLESNKSTLIIKKPQSWDIKNNEDILYQIQQAKTNGSPLYVIKKLVGELLYADLKENPNAKFIVDYIMKKDKLIVYGISDAANARINFGTDISEREMVIHDNGIQILIDLLNEGIKPEFDTIDPLFEDEIKTFIDNTVVQNTPAQAAVQ